MQKREGKINSPASMSTMLQGQQKIWWGKVSLHRRFLTLFLLRRSCSVDSWRLGSQQCAVNAKLFTELFQFYVRIRTWPFPTSNERMGLGNGLQVRVCITQRTGIRPNVLPDGKYITFATVLPKNQTWIWSGLWIYQQAYRKQIPQAGDIDSKTPTVALIMTETIEMEKKIYRNLTSRLARSNIENLSVSQFNQINPKKSNDSWVNVDAGEMRDDIMSHCCCFFFPGICLSLV